MPEGSPTLENVINSVAALPDDAARTQIVNGVPVRLHASSSPMAHRVEGEMIRIRMDTAPARASINGPVGDFDFDDDEGFGEETAFLYDTRYRILVLQRNHTGVSASSFSGYYELLPRLGGAVVLDPVMDPKTTAKFNELATIRQFEVSVAGITNSETIHDMNPNASVQKFPDLVDHFGAQSVRIYLSMEHQPGGLSLNRVKQAARQLLQASDDDHVAVRKIELSGRTPDDDALVVDLLRDRLVEEDEIPISTERRLPYEARRIALERAYSRQEGTLQGLFDEAVQGDG
jgi:hypothetical protein